MIEVKLLAYTPEPEKTVACAAKLCYSAAGIDTVMDGLTEEKTASFLKMLTDMGHESPIEHASFTFGIEGVSRALLAQITRHRLASFSVQSQRYVAENSFSFVLPPEIEKIPQAKAEFLLAMEEDTRHYEKLVEILIEAKLKTYTDAGDTIVSARKKAEKAAIEDARFVLPNACTTKMICTMNARSLLNFFKLRCCRRAQWEIRELATMMLKEVKCAAPNLFAKAGPACVSGGCSEGKMTCGKIREVREEFKQLSEKCEGKPWEG